LRLKRRPRWQSSWTSFLFSSISTYQLTLGLIVLSFLSLSKPFPVRQSFCIVIFLFQRFNFSTYSHCPKGAAHFVALDLSGTGVESVPDDIVQHLPGLQRLILDKCERLRFLPIQLGMLTGLESVSVLGCTALLYPPKSVQSNSKRMATFFKTLYTDSFLWRRLKVGTAVQPCPMPRSHKLCRSYFSATGAAARRPCCAH
jgi:hypothetical protein